MIFDWMFDFPVQPYWQFFSTELNLSILRTANTTTDLFPLEGVLRLAGLTRGWNLRSTFVIEVEIRNTKWRSVFWAGTILLKILKPCRKYWLKTPDKSTQASQTKGKKWHTINRSKNKQGFVSKIELLREINQNSLEIDFKLVARNDHNR